MTLSGVFKGRGRLGEMSGALFASLLRLLIQF